MTSCRNYTRSNPTLFARTIHRPKTRSTSSLAGHWQNSNNSPCVSTACVATLPVHSTASTRISPEISKRREIYPIVLELDLLSQAHLLYSHCDKKHDILKYHPLSEVHKKHQNSLLCIFQILSVLWFCVYSN